MCTIILFVPENIGNSDLAIEHTITLLLKNTENNSFDTTIMN